MVLSSGFTRTSKMLTEFSCPYGPSSEAVDPVAGSLAGPVTLMGDCSVRRCRSMTATPNRQLAVSGTEPHLDACICRADGDGWGLCPGRGLASGSLPGWDSQSQ